MYIPYVYPLGIYINVFFIELAIKLNIIKNMFPAELCWLFFKNIYPYLVEKGNRIFQQSFLKNIYPYLIEKGNKIFQQGFQKYL